MSDQSNQAESTDPRVQAAIREYLERVDRGEVVNRDEFLVRNIEIAAALRSFFAAEEPLRKMAATRTSKESAATSTQSIAAQGQETVLPKLRPGASAGTTGSGLAGKFGRYQIVSALGQGAMGAVYLAEDSQLKRRVAIKTPRLEEDPSGDLLQRFYREAESAATLRHANICPIHDVGEIDGKHFISMAYIEGRPLSDLIKGGKTQSERKILIAVHKLAQGLQHAHDQGIVHRDLKPANVMIDKQGEPIIMDFGLARKRRAEGEASITHTGVILGSPAYMSPEQVEGDPESVGPASDQYSLGVVLYEMLTGQLPFRGSVINVLAQIITAAPTPPGELRPGLDPRIEAVCLRMMAKKASDRFPSMKAVADQLATIVKNPAAASNNTAPATGENSPSGSRMLAAPAQAQSDSRASQIAKSLNPRSLTASDVTSIEELARTCLGRRDYDQVIQIVERIPEELRNESLKTLLAKASEKVDQIAFLICEIDGADRNQDGPTALEKAEKLLEIKPGDHRAQAILEKYSGQDAGAAAWLGPLSQFRRPWNEGGWIPRSALALGLAACAVLCGVIVISLGNKTAIVIDVRDPSIKVAVDRSTVTITGPNRETVPVAAGEHELKITYGGLDIVSKRFQLKRGDHKVVTVSLVDTKLVAKLVDEIIAEQDLKPPTTAIVTRPAPIVAKSLPQTSSPVESRDAGLKGQSSTTDPLPAGSVWTGSRTYRNGSWKGKTVDYELRVEQREGEKFSGLKFDNGRGRNRRPVSGEIHGNKVSWREGADWHMEGTIAGDFIELRFKGEFVRGRTEGDGLLKRDANAAGPAAENATSESVDPGPRPAAKPNDGFVPLFNGKDLTGWTTHESQREGWFVEEGVLVGRGPRRWGFLYTERDDFTDFHLRAEVRVNEHGNSGIYFRSGFGPSNAQNAFGRCPAGYQADIFDLEMGGLFTPNVGVLVPGRKSLVRGGEWFTLDVIAESNHITIKVNGVTTVDFVDERRRFTKGRIALERWLSERNTIAKVEFRKIEIQELTPQSASRAPTSDGAGGPSSDAAAQTTAEPDRRAAQAVLALGGSVTISINDQPRDVQPGQPLPDGTFLLTAIRLHDKPQLKDTDLEPLEGIAHLTKFGLNKVPYVTDGIIAHLRNCKQLEAFWFENANVGDAGLVHLEEFTGLKSLGLRGTHVTDAGLAHLDPLRQLEHVALGGTRITSAGLVHLRGLNRLEKLWLERTEIDDSGMEHLEGLANLKGVILFGTHVTGAGLIHLKGLVQLESLSLGGLKITNADLESLEQLTAMQNLVLNNTRISDAGLDHLQRMTHLQQLGLRRTRVTDAGLEKLKGMGSLRALNMVNTKVTAAGVAEFKKSHPDCEVQLHRTPRR